MCKICILCLENRNEISNYIQHNYMRKPKDWDQNNRFCHSWTDNFQKKCFGCPVLFFSCDFSSRLVNTFLLMSYMDQPVLKSVHMYLPLWSISASRVKLNNGLTYCPCHCSRHRIISVQYTCYISLFNIGTNLYFARCMVDNLTRDL